MKFPRTYIDKIKNETMELLGVSDSFRLNDKIDGIYFYHKQVKRVISIYHIGVLYDKQLLNDEYLLKSNSVFNLQGDELCILGVFFDEKIYIPKIEEKIDYFIVVGVFEDLSGSRILGKISYEKCLELSLKVSYNVLVDYLCLIERNDLEKL
jgi:hypothetical protein